MRTWPVVVSLLACTRAPSPAPAIADVAGPPPREPASREASPREPAAPQTPAPPSPPRFERPPSWPPELVFPDGFDPADTSLTVGEIGDLRLWQTVEGTTIDALATAWAQALEANGYSLREPCAQQPTHACAWTGHDRVVALEVAPGWRDGSVGATVQWLPAGHRPLAHLPGPCVKPPQRTREIDVRSSGIDQQGEFRQGEAHWSLSTRPSVDLDGDGRLDVLVPHAKLGSCPWEVPHDVYVMRGACGHRLGTVVGSIEEPTFTAPFHKGLRDIHTSASWASGARLVPEHHTRERRYVFDGRALRLVQDLHRSGQCHHCGVSSCTEP